MTLIPMLRSLYYPCDESEHTILASDSGNTWPGSMLHVINPQCACALGL